MAKKFVDPRTLHTAVYIDDSTQEPIMNCNLMGGDIQLGAVEVKNSTTDDRLLVNTDGSLNVNQIAINSDYAPGYEVADFGVSNNLSVDPSNALITRSTILTDEGGYRVNFSGSQLYIEIPNCTLYPNRFEYIGNVRLVDVHKGDYVYNSVDDTSIAVQIDYIEYDSSLTKSVVYFTEAYTGTIGLCTIRTSIVKLKLGSGCSHSVSNGSVILSSGNTSSSVLELERDVDYAPCLKQFSLSISQRIANQDIYAGFYDENNGSNARFFAWFHFSGTNGRTILCETAANRNTTPSASETEITTVQLTGDKITSKLLRYRIECSIDKVVFYIDDSIVATHFKSIPRLFDFLTSTVRVVNGTSPSSSTNISLDYDIVSNFNKVNIVQNKDDAAPVTSGTALEYTPATVVTPKPTKVNRFEFARSTTLGRFFDTICNAATQTITASTSGNMTITSGTTANAETILRSKVKIRDAFQLTGVVTCSARTANTDMFIEMVDVVGDNLPFTISGTTIVVTLINHPLETGQSINFGAIANLSGGPTVIPGRWVITATTSSTFTFTATGSSGTGSGTCSIYGANFARIDHLGSLTTAQAYFDCGRWGYSSGNTTATINTITSGHYFNVINEDGLVSFTDATSNASSIAERAQRTNNIPDQDVDMYLQIRLTNLTTNPAGSVTYTFAFLQIEEGATMPVTLRGGRLAGGPNLPLVKVLSMPSTTVTASNLSCNVAQINAATPLMGAGVTGTGSLRVTLAQDVGAASLHSLISANTTNATSVKASAGTVYGIQASNLNTSVRYLKLFNKASAPTVGSDTPIMRFAIPPNSVQFCVPIPSVGFRFSTGIAYCLTTGITDADTTAVAASEILVNIQYT